MEKDMRHLVALAAIVALSGCASWPASSYVVIQDDRDASALTPPIVDEVTANTQRGETVELLPPQDPNNMLTAFLLADLRRNGVQLVDTAATHRVQYIATPLLDGELLRVVIDGDRGGSQYFSRDRSGLLRAGGSFMEFRP